MKTRYRCFGFALILTGILGSCSGLQLSTPEDAKTTQRYDFVIAFGSCDDEDRENYLWDEVLSVQPDLWIWGGDNIYGDTEDMEVMERKYQKQLSDSLYQQLIASTQVMGTWDDHDYGVNDGGEEYPMKKESQQLLLDFLGVAKDSEQRTREGAYASRTFQTTHGGVKVIVLDTRYFRSPLQKSKDTSRRYDAATGTILGESQWTWLEDELTNSAADFNVIVSSIQVLSSEHGYEKWANFPDEQDRLFELLKSTRAKNIIILSGDRHISEFSGKVIEKRPLLVDFTSSGLTHAYRDFKGEPNSYRLGKVIHTESFGVLRFDFQKNLVEFQMIGDNSKVLQSRHQQY